MTADVSGILPHGSVRVVITLYDSDGKVIRADYEHRPCGMILTGDEIADNWCRHCAAIINKAAAKRARATRLARYT